MRNLRLSLTEIQKAIYIILIFLSIVLTSCGQNKYPGSFEIRNYQIGQKIDTNLFKKQASLYFPNYLDGWTMDNVSQLPKKYKGLPIGIWQLKTDSSIVLTLFENTIMNITVSFIKKMEIDSLSKIAFDRFGNDGVLKSYEQGHPLQSYITYWNLKTWETDDVTLQVGTSEMRNPSDSAQKEPLWDLVYSDFALERKIIANYKMK